MHESRPSWQIDECPSWCSGGHREHDHPDDRVHRSTSAAVPVVVRRTWFEESGIRRRAEATDFEVAVSRVDGEGEMWLYVGDGPSRSFELTAASAERVVREVCVALARAAKSR